MFSSGQSCPVVRATFRFLDLLAAFKMQLCDKKCVRARVTFDDHSFNPKRNFSAAELLRFVNAFNRIHLHRCYVPSVVSPLGTSSRGYTLNIEALSDRQVHICVQDATARLLSSSSNKSVVVISFA